MLHASRPFGPQAKKRAFARRSPIMSLVQKHIRRSSWNRIEMLVAATAAIAPLTARTFGSVVNVSWIAGAGTWGTAPNWTPSVIPNNSDANSYNAFVNSGAGSLNPVANVTLDRTVVLDSLTVGSRDTLNSPGQQLYVVGSGLVNDGTINVVNGAFGGQNCTIGGAGMISLSGPNSLFYVSD